MSLRSRLAHGSVTYLLRLACVMALCGLAMISLPVFSPRALPVVLSMSVGQGLGVGAFLTYVLAVVVDTARSAPRDRPSDAPPSSGARPPSEGRGA